MIFKTLNSTYEIDDNASRMRRVTGKNDPLIGPDGEWREFTDAGAWGGRMVFHFADGLALTTSPVVDWGEWAEVFNGLEDDANA